MPTWKRGAMEQWGRLTHTAPHKEPALMALGPEKVYSSVPPDQEELKHQQAVLDTETLEIQN